MSIKRIVLLMVAASWVLVGCDKDHAGRMSNNDGEDNGHAPSGGASGPEKPVPPSK